jgi:hypothetical protein
MITICLSNSMLMTHNFMLPSQLLHLHPQLIILNCVYLISLHSWYLHNGLAVNLVIQTIKSEAIMLLVPSHQVHPSIMPTAPYGLPFSNRITLDSNLNLDQHITALSKFCFFHIRALNHIRPVLTARRC